MECLPLQTHCLVVRYLHCGAVVSARQISVPFVSVLYEISWILLYIAVAVCLGSDVTIQI